jgi:poly(ribitol-phosphate) beta-N-acetylglucosaminyltransferase
LTVAQPPSKPRVSVVVPVFNPGREIEACIASLDGQTLPSEAYEVIYVDDGSTDGTSERLDGLEATSPNVRVIHLAPSGAPGRPRNVGLDAALGRYVYFVDSDDAIAPSTLERMTGAAERHDADVVLGKHASASLARGQAMFGRNRRDMTLRSTPSLIDSSLAPNKLFRLAFLRDAGIRFPEGWRLMEDQYFVLRAYFRARRISLLADQTYYYFRRREDGDHLSGQPLDPNADIDHLRVILDMIEAETQPGALRDRAIRRLYRVEILARLADEQYAELESSSRHLLFAAANRLASERIPASIDDGLNAVARLRSSLLRDGREDALAELARRTGDVRLQSAVLDARWHHGQIRLAFEAHLAFGGSGEPVTVVDTQGGRLLDPRLTDGVTNDPVPVDEELAAVRGNVVVRQHQTAAEWVVPTHLSLAFGGGREDTPEGAAVPIVRGEAYVDPLRLGPADRPLDIGRWALRLRLNLMGIDQRTVLTIEPARALRPAILGHPPMIVTPVIDDGLALDIGRLEAAAELPAWATSGRGGAARRVNVPLPLASHTGLKPFPAVVLAQSESETARWPAVARHRFGWLELGVLPASTSTGPVVLRAVMPGVEGEIPIGRATIRDGHIRLDSRSSFGAPSVSEAARWVATRGLDKSRQAYEDMIEAMTPLARRVFEGLPRPLRSPALRFTRFLRR